MNIPITSDMSYEVKASKIPDAKKKEITRAAIAMKGVLHPNESDVRMLFEIYHEYIVHYPPKDKINCNSCRVMVRDFWIRIVEESTIWD